MVPAHAQSTAPRNAHAALPEMVVSGSRSEQLSDELPLSIDVIDARALSDQQSRDVREALRDLPNTSVKHPLPRTTVGGANTVGTGRDGNVGLNIRGVATACSCWSMASACPAAMLFAPPRSTESTCPWSCSSASR
jgi:hemoglobin/transferrin/lactoferrin receptor protein